MEKPYVLGLDMGGTNSVLGGGGVAPRGRQARRSRAKASPSRKVSAPRPQGSSGQPTRTAPVLPALARRVANTHWHTDATMEAR